MYKKFLHKVYRILPIFLIIAPLSAYAADNVRPSFVPHQTSKLVSNRLIVKFKPDRLSGNQSSKQVAAELNRPLTAEKINQLQTVSGSTVSELFAISNGAHIIILHGQPEQATLNQAISSIRALSNVDYVEEDKILSIQSTPNDPDYLKLWGLRPTITVNSPAPGSTGSYGADFENAWNITTGSGVVVAVVDTGITPHDDLTGVGGTVTSATGNLASPGYDFITDCRIRGTCAATTTTGTTVTPGPNATDLGDFISVADSNTVGSLFYGAPVSDSSWHGTHVSGIVAALGNNSIGVIGGAYSARILPVRVLGKGGGYVSDISEGIRWAAGVHSTINNPNPARIINLSLGGSGACSRTEQDAINAAVAQNAIVLVAAGNSNTDVAYTSPANCNNTLSVAAIAKDGSRAYYSNFSSPASNYSNPAQITLSAQGGDKSLEPFDPGIYSSINGSTTTPTASSTYAYKQGTSMATPHVAAAVALMLARNPTLTPVQIKNILIASTTTFPSFTPTSWAPYDCAILKNCGAGILNANLAVLNSKTPFSASSDTIDFGAVYNNNPINKSVTLTNISGLPVTLDTARISSVNSASFSIATNTCAAIIPPTGSCDVSINFLPNAASLYSASFYIPAQPATDGAIVIGLYATARWPSTAANALATTRTSASNSNGGGGCSIASAAASPDISLVLSLLAIMAYRIRRHLAQPFGKD